MIAESVKAQTDLALPHQYKDIEGFYFVAAHTDSGTRFYSDPINTFEYAEKIYNNYISVIEYFDGGYVQMYKINEDNYEIIAYTRI